MTRRTTVRRCLDRAVAAVGLGLLLPVLPVLRVARLTPVGRRLRDTRLDRWPQLYHVLRGELALVGPRAAEPEDLAFVLRSVSAPARRRLELRDLRPGVFGPGPRRPPTGTCPFTALRDRVVFDLPWGGAWPDERGGLRADATALAADLRAWLSRSADTGNELVRWDLPRRFAHLSIDPHDLPRLPDDELPQRLAPTPAVELEDDASGITAFWYPRRGEGLSVPERGRFDMALVDELADEVTHERDRGLVVERRLAAAGGATAVDRVVVELPAGLHAIERVCAALHPLWCELAPRARDGEHFPWDLHVLLLESAAFVARLGPSGRERIAVEIAVRADRVSLRVALAGPSAGFVLSDSRLRELVRPLGLLDGRPLPRD